MAETDEEGLRERVLTLIAANKRETATIALLEALGPQIFGFLSARAPNPFDAGEIYSLFSEDVWRGIQSYAGRGSLRAWAYTLARHAASRHQKKNRVVSGEVPLSNVPELAALVDRQRSATPQYRQTDVKARVRALRDRLNPEDRDILILRIDRQMDWRDIAQIMLAEGQEPDESELVRAAARLRQRFARTKRQLHRWAVEDGIVPPSEDGP